MRVHRLLSHRPADDSPLMSDLPRLTRRRWLRRITICVAAVAIFLASVYGLLRWDHTYRYPYGFSHSCDKQLSAALREYAEQHDRKFPSGEATPEASLSLLYPEYVGASVLQGKTVPIKLVEQILESGERLGPDSCGWQYVDGLSLDDDRNVALFWDKVGLGHNGERRKIPGHLVFFVGGDSRFVAEADWAAFLAEQNKLLEERNRRKVDE